jgi:alpha-tubulin suppressor-like RCC1 family protein
VWSWGSNNSGQTGHGDTNTTNTPLRVVLMPPAKALAAGLTHVLALTTTGELWSWGSNESGKLGQGTLPGGASVMRVPARITASGPFVAIAAGAQHSLALHADGSVWAWGVNETGQLGTGSLSPGMSAVPVRVSGLPAGIRAIAAGGGRDGLGHSLALAPDGSVWRGATTRTGRSAMAARCASARHRCRCPA